MAFCAGKRRAGRQIYVVCPLIEESEAVDAKPAEEIYEFLRTQALSDLRVELVHGRMRPADKDAVIAAFARGEVDVLVSTTVIEVGVNVPNASVMVIENAERFGLAQLHQLRGRVGRRRRPGLVLSDGRAQRTLAHAYAKRTTVPGGAKRYGVARAGAKFWARGNPARFSKAPRSTLRCWPRRTTTPARFCARRMARKRPRPCASRGNASAIAWQKRG